VSDGSETVVPVTDLMWETALRIRQWYEMDGNAVGGALHIVTDDNNVETDHIRWCVDNFDGPDTYREPMLAITDALLTMPLVERWAVTTKLSTIYRAPIERPESVTCNIDPSEIEAWEADDAPSGVAPFSHDEAAGRFPAGTDPRDAIRETMGVFMERTDGTNAMPWWLRSPLRWWHAGPSGMKRGDVLLPPSVTGRVPLLNVTDRNSVYVTTGRPEALMYASHLIASDDSRWPSLYEVSSSDEPIEDDTQPGSTTSFRVPKATIRRVESPSRRELSEVMAQIMQYTERRLADSVIEAAERTARLAAEDG